VAGISALNSVWVKNSPATSPSARQVGANSGRMHRNKQHLQSITWVAVKAT
jgi:hypothetical protein